MDNKTKIKSWREFEQELAILGAQIRQMIELECDAFDSDPVASRQRHERALFDYQFFCQTYFPHYVPTDKFSLFQKFIFTRFPEIVNGAEDGREVHEAPRGEAKSTYETQLGALWSICRATYIQHLINAGKLPKKARKHMIGIIMNTEEQSAEMLESIKAELDTNPRLALDFPEATGQGKVWQATTAITANNIKIRIGGTGKKIRGMKHGSYRPDLIFLDDLENDEQVRQKAQRDKIVRYVLSAVLGLAPPMGGMDVFWVGTSLHYDAAINQVGDMPGWSKFVFKAIMRMPDNMALWDQWEAIYAVRGDNATKQAAATSAKRFFKQHEAAMTAGAEVSWEIRPLYKLMCIRASDHKSFDQEYQNQAGNDDNAPFKNITFWVNNLGNWTFYGAIDPSLGKKGADGIRRGDPSAILVGGFNREKMTLDVVEADICRRSVDMMINRTVDFQLQYGCVAWAVESVQFQYVLNELLLKAAIARGVAFPAVPVIPIGDKDLRIISLQPHINNGLIRIGHHQTTLYEQLFYYPEADHDDGPDALEMLWKIATEFSGEWSYTPANQSRGQRGYSESFADFDDDDFYGEDRR